VTAAAGVDDRCGQALRAGVEAEIERHLNRSAASV
jgi:hypothetical protein